MSMTIIIIAIIVTIPPQWGRLFEGNFYHFTYLPWGTRACLKLKPLCGVLKSTAVPGSGSMSEEVVKSRILKHCAQGLLLNILW